MKYLSEKLKSLSVGVMALSFIMAVSLSSCGTASNQSDDNADATEEQVDATSDEHPAAADEEHPAGEEEHAADSTSTEGGEHPQ